MRACVRTRKLHLILVFTVLVGSLSVAQAPKNDFGPLEFLSGNWVAEGGGRPGQGTGGFSFTPDLQGAVLIRKSYAEYPAAKDKPAYRHDDLMVIYKEPAANRLRAIFFDNEGHAIYYSIRADDSANSIEFLSELQPSAPRYRLTYYKAGADVLKLRFEIAPAGKPESFRTYIEAIAHRQKL